MDMMSYLMGRNSGGGGKGAKIEVVTELPETGEANVIYLVPKQTEDENNVFDEYLYINDEWELIGTTDIDLSGYQPLLTAGNNITIDNNNVISASGGSNLPIYYLFHNYPLSYQPNNMGSDIENIINDAYTKGYSTFTLLLICRQSIGGDFISQIYSNPTGFANYDLQSKPSRLTFQTFSTNDLSAYSCNTITINLSWNEDVAHFVSLQSASISRKYLTTANTTAYTPTSDYNPATKKYVDDSIAAAITTTLGGSY